MCLPRRLRSPGRHDSLADAVQILLRRVALERVGRLRDLNFRHPHASEKGSLVPRPESNQRTGLDGMFRLRQRGCYGRALTDTRSSGRLC